MKLKLNNIPYIMKLRWYAVSLSLILVAASVYLWVVTPSNEKFGVDFIGGVEIIAGFENPVEVATVRSQLENAGIQDPVIQSFNSLEGDTRHLFSIRIKAEDREDFSKFIQEALAAGLDNKVSMEKFDHVGPAIGEQIRRDAWWAIALSLIGITIYVGMRFEFRYAFGALVALAHDVIIAIGACLLTGREMNAVILAGLLTIVGFSINDTIVIFDRVRENLVNNIKNKKNLALGEVLDQSINETMSRTIITTLVCLFVVLSMYFIGGGALEDLAFVLLVGFVAGVYSTIFIAGTIVYWFDKFFNRKQAA